MELKSNRISKDIIVIKVPKSYLTIIGFIDTTNELLFSAIQKGFSNNTWVFDEWDVENRDHKEIGRVDFEPGTVITIDLLYKTMEKLELADWKDC